VVHRVLPNGALWYVGKPINYFAIFIEKPSFVLVIVPGPLGILPMVGQELIQALLISDLIVLLRLPSSFLIFLPNLLLVFLPIS